MINSSVAYGIVTSQRRESYLVDTLASLDKAGIRSPIICADGPIDNTICRVHNQWYTSSGPYLGYLRALSILLVTQSDRLVLFEDDIVVSSGLHDFVRQFQWPAAPGKRIAVSLYTPAALIPQCSHKGWCATPADAIQRPFAFPAGVCAMVYTRDAAAEFLAWAGRFKRTTGQGAMLIKFCQERRANWWVHNPSLVQHIGEVSTFHDFGLDDKRRAKGIPDQCPTLPNP